MLKLLCVLVGGGELAFTEGREVLSSIWEKKGGLWWSRAVCFLHGATTPSLLTSLGMTPAGPQGTQLLFFGAGSRSGS